MMGEGGGVCCLQILLHRLGGGDPQKDEGGHY